MTSRDKNLFAIAFLSLAILALGCVALVTMADGALFLIVMGLSGLGLAVYRLNQLPSPTFERLSETRFKLRRPYTLMDRYRNLQDYAAERVSTFRYTFPLTALVIGAVIGIIAFAFLLAVITLFFVGFNPLDKPGFGI